MYIDAVVSRGCAAPLAIDGRTSGAGARQPVRMPATPVSLLDRLQRQPDAQSWERLVQLYEPFIRRWLRDPALGPDADDLLQEVLAVLVRDLPAFRRQRSGSFRAWLRTVTVNKVNEWWR